MKVEGEQVGNSQGPRRGIGQKESGKRREKKKGEEVEEMEERKQQRRGIRQKKKWKEGGQGRGKEWNKAKGWREKWREREESGKGWVEGGKRMR